MPIRFLRDALPPLKKRLNVAFDAEAIFSSPLGSLSARPDKFILAMSHFDHDIRVEPADPMHVAGCMSSSVQFEQLAFFKHYLAFKFAFPDRQAEFHGNNRGTATMQILRRALSRKEAFLVSHPYPVSLSELSSHMVPVLTVPVHQRVA